jgi:hypothetical protein
MASRFSSFTSDAKRIGKIIKSGFDTKSKRVAEEWKQGIIDAMAESEERGEPYYYEGLGWTRASLPGRPPSIQTGEYVRSFQVRRVGRGPSWAVGTPDERGPWLELGTENMAARPHFEAGYRRNEAAVDREMNRPITTKEKHFGA